MTDMRNHSGDSPGRRDRVTRLRAVHRAWEVANGHYDPDPVALLYDILGGPLVSHPVFAPAYFAEGREAAIQAVINRYGLYAVEIRTLRDLVERTIRRA